MNFLFFIIFVWVMMMVAPAQAYLGPGLGAGTIGVVLGIVGAFFLALFAVVWYPVKRLIKRKKEQKKVIQGNDIQAKPSSDTTAKTASDGVASE